MLEEVSQSNSVESRKGVSTFLQVGLVAFSGFCTVSAFVNVYVFEQATMPLYLTAIGVAIILANIWLIPMALTMKLIITDSEISVTSIWGRRCVASEKVTEVRAIPTFFVRHLSELEVQGQQRPLRLLTALFANHRELHKALADTVYVKNSAAKVNIWFEAEYGKPPYGIFGKDWGKQDTSGIIFVQQHIC